MRTPSGEHVSLSAILPLEVDTQEAAESCILYLGGIAMILIVISVQHLIILII